MTVKHVCKTAALFALLATAAATAQAQTTAASAPPAADPQAQTPAAAAAAPTTPTATQGQAAATGTATATGPQAKDFIRTAYLANEFGIAASQVALAQSKSPATKQVAQKVLTNGMKERQDMIAAIQKATSDMHFDQAWDDKYKTMLADLKSAPEGKAFDAKYLQLQGAVTDQVQSAFADYAQTGTDQSIKVFAAATLPTLQSESGQLKATAG